MMNDMTFIPSFGYSAIHLQMALSSVPAPSVEVLVDWNRGSMLPVVCDSPIRLLIVSGWLFLH